ncbi:hypothetical protein B6I21_09300 [candidate division KSB1 bacterium 4572_119]|nr:MAG: hypothetical protein B6I21_09300 [candidate division KSB1 bacterium 4572_119]
MKPLASPTTKLLIAVLFSDEELLNAAKEKLHEKYGAIDFESQRFDFAVSDYYKPEMGWPIYRLFWSFEELINPKDIAPIKIECNEIEDQLAIQGKRKVNLDAGYLDYDKVVLASAKYNWQKIYLDNGIYADLTLRYEKGNYFPFPWSFPDFKEGHYNKMLLRIRELYKQQRKNKQ